MSKVKRFYDDEGNRTYTTPDEPVVAIAKAFGINTDNESKIKYMLKDLNQQLLTIGNDCIAHYRLFSSSYNVEDNELFLEQWKKEVNPDPVRQAMISIFIQFVLSGYLPEEFELVCLAVYNRIAFSSYEGLYVETV